MSDAVYPVEFARKIITPTYVYRLPTDIAKCYNFGLVNQPLGKAYMVCSRCRSIYTSNNKLKKIEIPPPAYRKFDKCILIDDPVLGHIPGCEPLSYSNLMEKHFLVENAQDTIATEGFPLLSIQNNSVFSFIHRVQGQSDKFYRFLKFKLEASEMTVRCTRCMQLKKYHLYTCTSDGFIDDPSLKHFPGCEPMNGAELDGKYEIIEKELAKKMIFKESVEEAIEQSNPVEMVEQDVVLYNNVPHLQPNPVPAIAVQAAQIFTHLFEMPHKIFSENGTELLLKGRRLKVSSEHVVTTKGAVGGTIWYEFDLPDYVDVSTIDYVWTDEGMQITAHMIN